MSTLFPNIPILLDGRSVEKITAFLFAKGGNEDPYALSANQGKSFLGSNILGMGFSFDDSNNEASPISVMDLLIQRDPKNKELIFPFLGGEEINDSPRHEHYRYIINFLDMSEEEAKKWPDLYKIVEEKVKPARLSQNVKNAQEKWWQFARIRPEFYRAIEDNKKVLVCCQTSKYRAFAFVPNRSVFTTKVVVFPLEEFALLSLLQSRVNENWSLFFGSSLEDRPVYTPSDCFETFPFPINWEQDLTLEAIGKTYYDYRAALMIRNNQGLTDIYNRFHNPEERDPDILKLRDLHNQMDRAVLDAYSWQDIDTTCGFGLDYLDGDPDDLPPEAAERVASGDLFFSTPDEATAFDRLVRTGRRKLPWRYKWPEGIHDEVLARLLDLNQQRYQEEIIGGSKAKEKPKGKGRKRKTETPGIPGLD